MRLRRESGLATAERAVAMPALVGVAAIALSAVSLGIDQVRCVDAARAGARALARGDSSDQATAVAARAGPPGARISTTASGDTVVVVVDADAPPVLSALGMDSGPSATATAQREANEPAGFGADP